MTVLLVLGGLAVLLALACWWEARTGRPQWGQPRPDALSPHEAALAAKRSIAATLVVGGMAGMDGGDG